MLRLRAHLATLIVGLCLAAPCLSQPAEYTIEYDQILDEYEVRGPTGELRGTVSYDSILDRWEYRSSDGSLESTASYNDILDEVEISVHDTDNHYDALGHPALKGGPSAEGGSPPPRSSNEKDEEGVGVTNFRIGGAAPRSSASEGVGTEDERMSLPPKSRESEKIFKLPEGGLRQPPEPQDPAEQPVIGEALDLPERRGEPIEEYIMREDVRARAAEVLRRAAKNPSQFSKPEMREINRLVEITERIFPRE
jgi:hypothetical protein